MSVTILIAVNPKSANKQCGVTDKSFCIKIKRKAILMASYSVPCQNSSFCEEWAGQVFPPL